MRAVLYTRASPLSNSGGAVMYTVTVEDGSIKGYSVTVATSSAPFELSCGRDMQIDKKE